MPLLSHVIVKY